MNADAEGRRPLRRQERLGACLTPSPYIELLLGGTAAAEREPEK